MNEPKANSSGSELILNLPVEGAPDITSLIRLVRDQRVILDAALAPNRREMPYPTGQRLEPANRFEDGASLRSNPVNAPRIIGPAQVNEINMAGCESIGVQRQPGCCGQPGAALDSDDLI